MAFDIKGAKEARGKIVAEMRAQIEEIEKRENKAPTPEDRAKEETLEKALAEATERVGRLEAQEDREKLLAETTEPETRAEAQAAQDSEENRALSLQAWMRAQSELPLGEEHRAACHATGVNPQKPYFDLRLQRGADYTKTRREYRAGMSTSVALGGYTIPQGFVNNFEIALLAYGGMRQAADVFRTAEGNDMPWPTANDTSNTGVLLGEETTIGNTVNPSVGVVTFKAYKMSSKLIQVSPELLQDSAFDMASQIGSWLGERIGRCENTYYTTGSGSSQPSGILGASGGATVATLSSGAAYTASATAITTDELIDLVHSVDPAYRSGGGFMMHDFIIRYLRKLKDGDGQYIWQPGLQTGVGDRLLGYPVITNQDMASSCTAGYKTVLFGALNKFKIRDVAEIRLRRLVERYADTDQEGFVAFHRTDSRLLDAGTYPVRYLLQHA